MKSRLFLMGCFFSLALLATAQSKPETLTNKSVTDLYKAGLDNATIVAKIKSSVCKFDVTTTGLLSLKKDDMPSEIINAMLDKASGAAEDAYQPKTSIATAPGISAPATLNEVNYIDKATRSVKALEKGKAALAIKGMGMGNSNFELEGEKSTFRISGDDAPSFTVSLTEAQGDPSGWFTLYKLTIKKNKRSVTWVKGLSMGKSSSKEVVAFTVIQSGKAVFEMILSVKLDKGEYFFLAKGTMGNYAGRAADAFAFGID